MPLIHSPFLESGPVRCMITGGTSVYSEFESDKHTILSQIDSAKTGGVQIVQIREKLLPARMLRAIVGKAVEICAGSRTRVLVNERFDIALAAGADGVHLTASSLECRVVREVTPEGFLIGVSAHSLEEAKAARSGGADYVMYGPVFDTPSKRKFGKPMGLDNLEVVCSELDGFPVLAVGGIHEYKAEAVTERGAAGFAAIRLFENPKKFLLTDRIDEQ